MAKRGHSEEEILRVLREAESGDSVVEVCRQHGISQQTFYFGRRSMPVSDLANCGNSVNCETRIRS